MAPQPVQATHQDISFQTDVSLSNDFAGPDRDVAYSFTSLDAVDINGPARPSIQATYNEFADYEPPAVTVSENLKVGPEAELDMNGLNADFNSLLQAMKEATATAATALTAGAFGDGRQAPPAGDNLATPASLVEGRNKVSVDNTTTPVLA